MSRTMPNFLLVISDCTRPDRLSCYGYEKKTTPDIDKIAEEGTLFTNAVTQGVWTLPSHASLFTGLYPSEHGLLSATERLDIKLNREITVMAEWLKQLGYITAGISNNPWVGHISGLNRGFDFFVESDGSIQDNMGIDVKAPFKISAINKIQSSIGGFTFKLLIPYLVKRPTFTTFSVNLAKKIMTYAKNAEKKFFIFMNLMDAHQPYYPPRHILKNISDSNYFYFTSFYHNYQIRKFLKGENNSNLRGVLNNYYDASLTYQNQELGKLFSHMHQENIFDKTMVIFTSDHGKNLGEHRFKDKLNFLKDNVVKIPLIVRYPDLFPKNERVNEIVQFVDINYTIRKMMNMPNLHKNDCTLLDAIEGKGRFFAYIEAELPYNMLEEDVKTDDEQDVAEAIISIKEKLIKSKNNGFLVSKFGANLDDEKFIDAEPNKHDELMHYFNEVKKMIYQTTPLKDEKKLIADAIRKKRNKHQKTKPKKKKPLK